MAAAGRETGGEGEGCRRGRLREEFGGVTPVLAPIAQRKRPADVRSQRRSGEAAPCEHTKRWFILPILPRVTTYETGGGSKLTA